MPLIHETVMFDVVDAKVYPLLTDVAGASPTYGTGVDVPGIAEVGVDPNLVTAELKGDSRVIAKKGKIDRYNFTGTYGKLSLEVLKVIINIAVTDSGTTPNQRATGRSKSPQTLPYFKLAFKIDDIDTGLGSLITTLYKCQITGGTLIGGTVDSFGQPTFQAEAISMNGKMPAPGTASPLVDDFVLADWDFYETVQGSA